MEQNAARMYFMGAHLPPGMHPGNYPELALMGQDGPVGQLEEQVQGRGEAGEGMEGSKGSKGNMGGTWRDEGRQGEHGGTWGNMTG